MEEVPEKGKVPSYSAHSEGMNLEISVTFVMAFQDCEMHVLDSS